MNDQQPCFAMLTCAHGAEGVVKSAVTDAGWRLAFSRPGFVTLKHDESTALPEGTFVRTAAYSIGQTRDASFAKQMDSLHQMLEQSSRANRPFDQIHVWPKDRAPIGRFGFEPGIDEVSRSIAEEITSKIDSRFMNGSQPNIIAQPDDRVLDIVLVQSDHWFVGTHTATTWPTRWPGGVQPIHPKSPPISRAYYKAAEAITWSGFDWKPGDLVVEIGSAPGGSCGRLLELGMRVIGVDPATMDPRIAEHPKFQHHLARAGDLPRKVFRGAKWLLVDSNVAPEKTLTTVANLVTHQQTQFAGLLLTMKLGEYQDIHRIDSWKQTVMSWGAKQVNVRQLARNRCEVCFAVRM